MPAVFQVNENTSAYLSVTFKDKAGAASAPTSVTYSIWCATNAQEVKASTAVSAAGTVEIGILAADNVILDKTNSFERRIVTVVGSYGASDAVSEQFEFLVRNLARVAP